MKKDFQKNEIHENIFQKKIISKKKHSPKNKTFHVNNIPKKIKKKYFIKINNRLTEKKNIKKIFSLK